MHSEDLVFLNLGSDSTTAFALNQLPRTGRDIYQCLSAIKRHYPPYLGEHPFITNGNAKLHEISLKHFILLPGTQWKASSRYRLTLTCLPITFPVGLIETAVKAYSHTPQERR